MNSLPALELPSVERDGQFTNILEELWIFKGISWNEWAFIQNTIQNIIVKSLKSHN